MDPSDILFNTPTLNDALPQVGDMVAGDKCIRMHEDDWRQFEFVSSAFAEELSAELSAIDAIWKEHSVPLDGGHAFRSVHVRKAIPEPFNIPFAVSDLETMFGSQTEPISLLGYDSVLADVYAISLENLVVYAVISDGKMTTLGLEPLGAFTLQGDLAERFNTFLTKHDLRLVHWRSRTLFESPAHAMKYLTGNGS